MGILTRLTLNPLRPFVLTCSDVLRRASSTPRRGRSRDGASRARACPSPSSALEGAGDGRQWRWAKTTTTARDNGGDSGGGGGDAAAACFPPASPPRGPGHPWAPPSLPRRPPWAPPADCTTNDDAASSGRPPAGAPVCRGGPPARASAPAVDPPPAAL